jgi:hypothetical protein
MQDLETGLTHTNGVATYELSPQERQAIVALYDRYDHLRGEPHNDLLAENLAEALRNAIRVAYDETQKGRRLEGLRNRIKVVASRCPLCGIGPVTDLDHHLPKTSYSALAVYSRNLVPMCGTCNNKKRGVGGVAAPPAGRFIHPYFQEFPAAPFFLAHAAFNEAGGLMVTFGVEQVAGMSGALFDRLTYQIGRLELTTRYRAEINIFLTSQEVALHDAYGPEGNAARLQDFIRRTAARLEVNFGVNDWRSSLMRALENSADFCNGGFVTALGAAVQVEA